jgi:nucleotide-binding universal stress UspA family protein
MGVLNQDLFTLIVTMAVVTTMAMPTMLRWALKRLPLRKKERQRLAREELDARGFVTNLERLLLAADDSDNGKNASRLVGAIAGSGGKPTTVLAMGDGRRGKKAAPALENSAAKQAANDANDEKPEQQVRTTAAETTTLEAHPDEEKSGSVEVTTRQVQTISPETVAGEAHKGYDLLIVGIAKTRNPKGGFSKDVSLLTKEFEGPLAVVDSHGASAGGLFERSGRILIPVNGSEVSRRAVEVGLTLARANDSEVTALYVTRAGTNGNNRKASPRRQATRRNELAVLKDIGALADRYDVNLRSTTRANMAPDEAILREAKRGYDLIVLGVSRRPGDTLFFGNTAAAVLDHSETSNLFIAS